MLTPPGSPHRAHDVQTARALRGRRFVLACAALALAGLAVACGPSRIENVKGLRIDDETDILDTERHRAILEVLTNYHGAMEARNADALKSLVSEDYYENAGTSDRTDDDYGYQTLNAAFAILDSVEVLKCDILIKDLRVDGNRAQVFYEYTFNYLYKVGGVPRWEAGRDLNRMDLIRDQDNGRWMIYRGL